MSSVAILPSWDILVQRSGRGLEEHGGTCMDVQDVRGFFWVCLVGLLGCGRFQVDWLVGAVREPPLRWLVLIAALRDVGRFWIRPLFQHCPRCQAVGPEVGCWCVAFLHRSG